MSYKRVRFGLTILCSIMIFFYTTGSASARSATGVCSTAAIRSAASYGTRWSLRISRFFRTISIFFTIIRITSTDFACVIYTNKRHKDQNPQNHICGSFDFFFVIFFSNNYFLSFLFYFRCSLKKKSFVLFFFRKK